MNNHQCTERCSLPSGGCVFALLRANPDGLTLEEVGRVFGLTRERIRQIEAVAIRKLRLREERADAETSKSRGPTC